MLICDNCKHKNKNEIYCSDCTRTVDIMSGEMSDPTNFEQKEEEMKEACEHFVPKKKHNDTYISVNSGRYPFCENCEYYKNDKCEREEEMKESDKKGIAKATYCAGCKWFIDYGAGGKVCTNLEGCTNHDKYEPIEPKEKNYEMVNHPDHYKMENDIYEPYKVINAWNLDFNLGSVLKYIARAGKKPGEDAVRDLNKCIEYLQFEIEKIKN